MSRENWGLLVMLSLLWGGAFVVADYLLQHLPPVTLVWMRMCLAAPMIAVIARLSGVALPKGRQWRDLAVLGLINAALPFALLNLAQKEISGALVSILNATFPIAVLIALRIFLGQKLGIYRMMGVAVGVAGVAVMMLGAVGGTFTAILFCIGATASHALGQIWILRIGGSGLQPMQVAFGQMFWAAFYLAPAALIFDQPWTITPPPPQVWLVMLGLAGFSTALGYILFFRILASAGALASSLVTLLVPVATVVMSAVIYARVPSGQHLAGMALILSGLGLIELARRREAPSA